MEDLYRRTNCQEICKSGLKIQNGCQDVDSWGGRPCRFASDCGRFCCGSAMFSGRWSSRSSVPSKYPSLTAISHLSPYTSSLLLLRCKRHPSISSHYGDAKTWIHGVDDLVVLPLTVVDFAVGRPSLTAISHLSPYTSSLLLLRCKRHPQRTIGR
jgi:hypothetical protein